MAQAKTTKTEEKGTPIDESKTEIAKEENKELSVDSYDYGEDTSAGFENQTGEDMTIPFLAILQDLSPQVKSREADVGQIFNTVTDEITDGKEGIVFVPAHTEHTYVEWVPRKKGGGFVGKHDINSDVVAVAKERSEEFGKYKTEAENDLVETFYIYGILCDGDDVGEMIVIPFTSMKIKPYKNWNTKINMFTFKGKNGRKQKPPLFAHRVRMTTTILKKNNDEYANPVLSPYGENLKDSLLAPGCELMEAAKDYRDLIKQGLAKVDYNTQEKATGDAEEGKKKTDKVF